MVRSFGPRLRAEREGKNLPLQAVAEETKIKIALLEGLEQDDLTFWPHGLFRRAYVRAYARAIGLDPEHTLRDFLQHYPEPVEPEPDDPIRSPRDLLSSPIATVSSLLRRGGRSEPALVYPTRPVESRRVPAVEAVVRDTPEPAVVDEPLSESSVGEELETEVIAQPLLEAEVIEEPLVETEVIDATVEEPSVAEVADTVEPAAEPSLLEMSTLCTRLAGLSDGRGLSPLLDDAARVLDAVGLVVWCWDARAGRLRAELANGYSDEMIARLPAVPVDAANAVAAAFRTAETCVVPGGAGLTAAVAVPVIAPTGCVGVLAIEVHGGCERRDSTRAFAAILAAQLAGFLGTVTLAEAVA
jgi:cytoskeletal protein RodZ